MYLHDTCSGNEVSENPEPVILGSYAPSKDIKEPIFQIKICRR